MLFRWSPYAYATVLPLRLLFSPLVFGALADRHVSPVRVCGGWRLAVEGHGAGRLVPSPRRTARSHCSGLFLQAGTY